MLIATLSCSKLEIIQLQQEESAARGNVRRRRFFLYVEGIGTAITYTNLAICFLDKAHVNKMKQKINFFPGHWISLFKH